MTNHQIPMTNGIAVRFRVTGFGHWDLGFPSDFEIRISDFEPIAAYKREVETILL
jgi:hypothetical protein